jgi:POT family proton-dependent oligopeptide transporter
MLLVVATYFWHTVGELCLSPTGLSYVTKAAPARYVSLLMGVWFVSSFLANLGGGIVAAQVEAIERGEIALPWHFGGQADFFLLFVVSSWAAAALMFALAPVLGRFTRE